MLSSEDFPEKRNAFEASLGRKNRPWLHRGSAGTGSEQEEGGVFDKRKRSCSRFSLLDRSARCTSRQMERTEDRRRPEGKGRGRKRNGEAPSAVVLSLGMQG